MATITRRAAGTTKKNIVQVRNPKTGRYVKIDRSAGRIISHKQSAGPYKGVPLAAKTASKKS